MAEVIRILLSEEDSHRLRACLPVPCSRTRLVFHAAKVMLCGLLIMLLMFAACLFVYLQGEGYEKFDGFENDFSVHADVADDHSGGGSR